MSIKQIIYKEKNEVVISIDGKFDFSEYQCFRDAYIGCDHDRVCFILDLSKTDYMDSSALGMILLLKDHAENLSGQVIIHKPSDTVYKILEIAQFHHLLTIRR